MKVLLFVIICPTFPGGCSEVVDEFSLLPIYSQADEDFLPPDIIGGILYCLLVVIHVRNGQSLEGSAKFLRVPLMVKCL